MPVPTSTPTTMWSHLVEAGGILGQIAERYGTTMEALPRVNELEAPYYIIRRTGSDPALEEGTL